MKATRTKILSQYDPTKSTTNDHWVDETDNHYLYTPHRLSYTWFVFNLIVNGGHYLKSWVWYLMTFVDLHYGNFLHYDNLWSTNQTRKKLHYSRINVLSRANMIAYHQVFLSMVFDYINMPSYDPKKPIESCYFNYKFKLIYQKLSSGAQIFETSNNVKRIWWNYWKKINHAHLSLVVI